MCASFEILLRDSHPQITQLGMEISFVIDDKHMCV